MEKKKKKKVQTHVHFNALIYEHKKIIKIFFIHVQTQDNNIIYKKNFFLTYAILSFNYT